MLNFALPARSLQAGKILLALRRAGGTVVTKLEGCIGLVVHRARGKGEGVLTVVTESEG